MRLYHGSNVVVGSPSFIVHNRALDYGAGFYTTSNLEQAVKFSLKVAARRGGEPVVNIYEYDDANPDCLSVGTFDNPCEDWLNFVTLNRSSENVECPFDVVVGPVANDDVYTTI